MRDNAYLSTMFGARGLLPNRWDILALPLIIGVFAAIVLGLHQMSAPVEVLQQTTITLDPANLPNYALRTTLRMLAALVASLVFTLIYATAAAKSRRLGMVLIPILDVLQSVPVLGYLSFTVVFFISLFPHSVMGAELAAIFAIFTSQAWNMTFSFYQSLITVPRDLEEACRAFHFSFWQRYWRLEVPFAMPGPGVEHDDVHVGRLVLRRGGQGHHGGRQADYAARSAPICRSPSKSKASSRSAGSFSP